jgi:hypothetical protein
MDGGDSVRRGQKPKLLWANPPDGLVSEPRLLGIDLSTDFCAEHEWGIANLKRDFGISDDISVYGLARRKVTRIPEELKWVEFKSTLTVARYNAEPGEKLGKKMLSNAGFVYHFWLGREPEKLGTHSELSGRGLRTAWSENDFAAVSNDPADITALYELFTELKMGNAVIMLGGSQNPFENAGMVIAIADRLPALLFEEWYAFDADYHKMRQEFDATGIELILNAAGKKYFALSPRRQKDGSLLYWLNPYEQQTTNFGWFTLEDLRLWAVDQGPIPMSAEQLEKKASCK